MEKKKATAEERRLASRDLINYYLNVYSNEWRLVKILSLQKILDDKYEFYQSIVSKVSFKGDEAIIAQEITTGLYFNGIAECVQYVEDLFALINASSNQNTFIKNVVTYKAGTITNLIKNFKINEKSMGETFHFPTDLKFNDNENGIASYHRGIGHLNDLLEEITTFYSNYEFFYNQYKHGLTIPMRPLANKFTKEQIEDEKSGKLPTMLVALDNFNVVTAGKSNKFEPIFGVVMPGFTENVQKIITDLHTENNYLRFVFVPDRDLKFDKLVDIAYKIQCCIHIFIYNFHHIINDVGIINCKLPISYKEKKVFEVTYRKD